MRRNHSHKNQNVSISPDSAYNSITYVPLIIQWKPDCRSRKQKRKDKLIKMHVPTLCSSSSASTLTIWFSPDHKWNVSDRVVKEIGTLLSLARTLYASDYDSNSDSDSVTSENQPLWFAVLKRIAVCVPFISRSKLSAVWTAQAICLKNLSAIQTAWAICAKTLLSFPKSGVICICFLSIQTAGAIFSKKIPRFYPKRISLPVICVVNLFSKAMSTQVRTIF